MEKELKRRSTRVPVKRPDAAVNSEKASVKCDDGENGHKRSTEAETGCQMVPKRLKLSNYKTVVSTVHRLLWKTDPAGSIAEKKTVERRTDVEDWSQNHLILQSVFKNLGVSDLKNARGVCRMWAEVGGSALAPKTVATDALKGETQIALNFPGVEPLKLVSDTREKCRGLHFKTLMLNEDLAEGMGIQNMLKIKHLEVQTDRQDWSRSELSKTLEFFKTPLVQNLESLRISGFRVDVMQNFILPYFLPKYMKKLRSLKLFGPLVFARPSLLPEDEPVRETAQLEELTIHFLGVSTFSWEFLEKCPKLKKLCVNGKEPSQFRSSFRLKNDFGLCFLDFPKYVHHTAIRSVSLKCDLGTNSAENAYSFMKTFVVGEHLNLDHVTYKFGGCYHLVPQFLAMLPPPMKSAKVVVDAIDFGEPFNFMYTSTQLPALLNLLESKKYSLLKSMEFRLRLKSIHPSKKISDFFTLFKRENRIILHLPPQKFLRRYIDIWGYFHSTFLSWFPAAQQLCNITNNGLKKRTVLNIQHGQYVTVTQEITSGPVYGDVRWIQRPSKGQPEDRTHKRISQFDVLLNGRNNPMVFEHFSDVDFEKTFFFMRLDDNPSAILDNIHEHGNGDGSRTTRRV